MKRVIDAMAGEGQALMQAAQAVGGAIDFDPQMALSRDAILNLQAPSLWSPNGHCRLVEAQDGWLAVNLAREDDRQTVPAWIGSALEDEPWDAVITGSRQEECATIIERAILLHLPVAKVGEAAPAPAPILHKAAPRVAPLKVLDLSALWAGPYCGGLLAEAGLVVTKVDAPSRIDPTARNTPQLDERLNGLKRRCSLSFESSAFAKMLNEADVLITSGRPHALARLGLNETTMFMRNPNLLWIAITAQGWRGDAAMRVGFGDDTAAAGGLIGWAGNNPHFLGDALADPITGLRAATLALEAIARGETGLIDVALAPTAARFAALL
ncbi:MAG: CoA transferase [Novosphingobium sp.]